MPLKDANATNPAAQSVRHAEELQERQASNSPSERRWRREIPAEFLHGRELGVHLERACERGRSLGRGTPVADSSINAAWPTEVTEDPDVERWLAFFEEQSRRGGAATALAP